ncbi:hypothetical protein [uncultured Tenacibaculum sp.]|uniref:hypothetical protein n=1 Tax=uncultured Tenacibaculum sp. TaxID=174713 RepID=UPI0026265B2C|nr:hypothetical protein [uncultured Tenacibaculum sp.]
MINSIIQKYNALHNTLIDRSSLEELLTSLNSIKDKTKEAQYMYDRIKHVLESHTDKSFNIKLSKKIIVQGLNAPLTKKLSKPKFKQGQKVEFKGRVCIVTKAKKITKRDFHSGKENYKYNLKYSNGRKVENVLESNLKHFTKPKKRKTQGLNAPEQITVDLPPIKKVTVDLVEHKVAPATKLQQVQQNRNKIATKPQQPNISYPDVLSIEKQEVNVSSQHFATKPQQEINKNATVVATIPQQLQQNRNNIATENQQPLKQKSNPFKTSFQLLNQEQTEPTEYFKILNEDLALFLGKPEIKKKGSLVITLDSEEGGGKTHTAYQFANSFAEAGYKGVIFSFEEGADNSLSKEKQKKYFTEQTQHLISVVEDSNELTNAENYQMITDNIDYFDFIVIDSWAKILELNSKAKIDKDFRKKYNGKLFLIINQRVSGGAMRGGTNVAFDGDIILKGEVDREDFSNNFIYNHKNRYNDYHPLKELKYSPFYQKLLPTKQEVDI